MNTRWHEEDVAGRVFEQIERKVIKGRVISISAIADAEDPLGRNTWRIPTALVTRQCSTKLVPALCRGLFLLERLNAELAK
jgi:hypothetical protein